MIPSYGGTVLLDLIFEDFVYFVKKLKKKKKHHHHHQQQQQQHLTEYPMDLIRNVPMNLKITILFQ